MDVDIKEEPPLEIEGYMLIDATVDQNIGFSDAAEDQKLGFSEDDQDKPRKKRKRSKKHKNIAQFNANGDMQQLLQEWGLEILCERFSKNLIDLTVLDYIVDVDIVDLCRDLPIRYRLILRHKLAEKRGKSVHKLDLNGEQTEKANNWRSSSHYEKSRMEPSQRLTDEHRPKRARCPIDMVLERPFATRTEEEKRLLISMEIPRPAMPELKSHFTRKGCKSTLTRKFYRTSYESAWWLCGSQKRNKLFCWPCLLFTQPTDPVSNVWGKRGIDDLNHLSSTVKCHSLSQRHIDNANAYKQYGQPPGTTDNETQSGSAADKGVSNNSKRSAKVSSNDSSKQANGKKVSNKLDKIPVVDVIATLEDDPDSEEAEFENSNEPCKPPSISSID